MGSWSNEQPAPTDPKCWFEGGLETHDVGHQRPRRAGEQGMSSGSVLEALQLQRLERWSSLLLRTFASMMAEHATTEPLRSGFIAFYVALAKLHGHVRGLRAGSDQPEHALSPKPGGPPRRNRAKGLT